jgi:hypothetical protein
MSRRLTTEILERARLPGSGRALVTPRGAQVPVEESASSGEKGQNLVRCDRPALHREDAEDPCRSIKIVGDAEEIDQSMKPTFSQPLDLPSPSFEEKVEIEHLLLYGIVDHDLAGR